jgi:hypothetical protein
MMMQNEGSTDTEGKGLVQDASEAFLNQKFNIGVGSKLTDPTFPLSRVGVEFYLTTDLKTLKDRVFGELESTAAKVDTAFQSIVNKMGDGEGLGASIRKNFTEAVSSVQLIGMDFKDVQTAAESTLEVFGRNVTLSGEEYKNLLATQQVTGQNVKQLEEGFLNAGMSIKDITKEMYNVTQVANAIGVNARLVSANVVSNLDKLNRYGFQSGVEGLAKMAAKAAVLRIELTDTLSIADDLMDPEGAIELASTLQRLGTTSASLTDPLRLMDMAQNDVGALQEELAKMFSTYAEFSEENQRFEILPTARKELRQLEKELGLPLGTIEKMAIGTKELDKKLSEISFNRFDVPQETQELIANMSMMNEEGEYVIKYVDEEGKAREETTAEFLEEFGGDVEKMQKALGRQKEEEGKSIEDKMYDRAGETLSSMQRLEAYNKAAADALGLATGGGEFGKQVLESNEALAKSFNTSIIQNMGPNGPIATAFNKSAEQQQKNFDILTGKVQGDKGKAAVDIIKGATDMVGTVATQAGNAAVGVLKDVGKTVGVDESSLMSGLTDFMNSVGITDQSLKDWTKTLTDSKNEILNLVPSGVKNIFQSTPSPATGTATGPTSSITPIQAGNTPTTVQQVNEITSLPIQSTAENLLAPEIQQATKEGMSQALDEELSYYSASPSLAVTIKKDETEGKRIQVPKKSEEIPTEANLVQQTNENVTEINQTETQQTTNLGNETNFNVLNEVFDTANEELKDISVTNSSLLKTSSEYFDKTQSLITNTNAILSSIQQSSTLVKTNNTVASTTTTTTISPTPAAAVTTTEPTVTKPETPKAEETKETKIEVKKASKEDVGLFGQSPLMTGPLKIKEEEEIEKRTEFVTKLTDVEIKNYEDKKKEQVTFTDFLNKENEIRQESTKDIQKQKTISLDNQTQEFIFGQELNEQIIERDNYVTQFTEEEIRLINQQNERQLSFNESFEQEIVKREQNQKNINSQNLVSSNALREQSSIQTELNNQTSTRKDLVTMMSSKELQTFEDKKNQQSTFTNFLNQENDVRRQTLEDIQKQKTISSETQNKEFIFGQQLNEQIIERDNYVTQFTEEEIRLIEEQNNKQLSFNELFEQEIEKRRISTENNLNQQSIIANTNKEEISVGKQLNEQMIERNEFVSMLSEQEISKLDQQNKRQLSFNNLLNQENSIREEYVTKLQETEKDKSVTSVVSGGELTNVSETLSTVNKETVKNETKTVSEVARRIHERAKMLYDGVIDESEKSVATAINDAEVLKTPPATAETTRKTDNKNLFGTEPSDLGKYVATGKAAEPVTPTVSKPFIPEFNKTDVDRSVTNFVNQVLPKSTGVNLFDTKPSDLGKYVPTGKSAEPVTPTVFKPDIPKPTTGERTVVTETDFGFGQEIPTSVAEFKGAEDIVNQFLNPEAIAASPTPIVQPDVEKVQELQKSTTSTQNINDNRTLDVTIKTPDIKDPAVAENYRKDVIKILKGEFPDMLARDKGLQDQIRSYKTPNFGLTGSQTPGV